MFNCLFCKSKKSIDINQINYYEEKSEETEFKLPDNKRYYQLLISRLLESTNYIVKSDHKEHNGLIFQYYFCMYLACDKLIYENLTNFTDYFELELSIYHFLEILLSIKTIIIESISQKQIDQISKFIFKIEGDHLFYRFNLFNFRTEEERFYHFYHDFHKKCIKINRSDFERIKANMRGLFNAINYLILEKV